jgi:hypothetical protein
MKVYATSLLGMRLLGRSPTSERGRRRPSARARRVHMRARYVRIFVGLVLVILGASYAVHAQQKKPDTFVQMKVYKNGSEVEDHNFTQFNGVQGSVRLIDGTELKITVSAITR